MDLSGLKWPLIIVIVALGCWLVFGGGVNFMYHRFTATPVDQQDAKTQEAYEAGLSRLGGFLLATFRYAKAEEVLRTAVDRYPDGKNVLFNELRIAKCAEQQGRFKECLIILIDLRDMGAHQYDERVPDHDQLQLRIQKLAEIHELGDMGSI